MFEGDTFPVIVKVRNTGAFGLIGDNKAILSLGVEKDYTKDVKLLPTGRVQQFGDIKDAATFNLDGRSNVNLKGDEEVVSYNIKAGKIDPQSEAHSSTVVASLCYPYNAILDATVCIDTDVSNLRPGKKACKAQDLVFSNGQGAPVAITKIEVNMLPSQLSEQAPEYKKIVPQFLIYIENKGQGTAIKNDAVKDFCTKGGTSHKNINTIYIKASLPNEELDCTSKEKDTNEKIAIAKLKDKKDVVRCTSKNGIDAKLDPYFSPLKVELTYGYTQSILSNYFIQKASRT